MEIKGVYNKDFNKPATVPSSSTAPLSSKQIRDEVRSGDRQTYVLQGLEAVTTAGVNLHSWLAAVRTATELSYTETVTLNHPL